MDDAKQEFTSAKKIETYTEAIEQLKWCGYECEGGPLENNVAFQMLEELVKEIDNAETTLEALIEQRTEFGLEMLLSLLKDNYDLFFERGNCAWGETDVVLGAMLVGTPDMDNYFRLALFNYDRVFVKFWEPAGDDIFADDWRVADLERNKACKAKLDAYRMRAIRARNGIASVDNSETDECAYDDDESNLDDVDMETLENITD